jgi:hypothetical protein
MKTKKFQILIVGATVLITGCTPIAQAATGYIPRAAVSATPLVQANLPDAVRPVFENYLKIHAALAQDSLQGVAENAAAIAQAVRGNPGKPFPSRVARQADRLANAKNLTAARDAFLRISPHLIDYVKKNRATGFYLGYCRMERVTWLQAGPTIANPYMGKAMPRCAWFRELNGARSS